MASCSCKLVTETGSFAGSLFLSQASEESSTVIVGEIRGLTAGKHGISVNVHGNLSGGAAGCGPIFNPFGKNHGSPEDEERMAGDLGNLIVTADGKCTVNIDGKQVKLIGPHSVIGRSIVVYGGEDDCGRGGHELSLSTGNSGNRVAVGVIGIAARP
uniref:Superoxide dismutase copper/zinc binding domain-containing protein n=1 Tax=Eucampia antarctica TaxID=49252 RepID=A0A7S2SG03_9STRA|mmetsp:Transcript_7692/g.7247  ORF Transcript_7692/g.7247 Transcript_7692/m.7247 type:complete len:157 (+) Transcript_7692:86-556(+)|eukprot:CAMPEP_0197823948 /NCGR_PEP_ID=MMETSP1437-20131217/1264_1 /TAXON_ID=49252 ORGANISM="Eucampia antarctica, Strain CCMP1452" /NCGR_SAMPLE_ID=MMETSP1437 /ASSEMBLY_ACC=CAM_ASM_001096 /LENGTH=156 /DNA_ID=CAMNT_0043423379 /DNA_START=80 /DNA_END=550 /DNA_ORIENTATION=+